MFKSKFVLLNAAKKLKAPTTNKKYKTIETIPSTKPAIAIPFPPLFFPIIPKIIAKIEHGIEM